MYKVVENPEGKWVVEKIEGENLFGGHKHKRCAQSVARELNGLDLNFDWRSCPEDGDGWSDNNTV